MHNQVMTILKQVAALPIRATDEGAIEILLVTSRDTGRWVLPKGWPSKHLSDAEAALREARQEAGVVGKIECEPIGSYRYRKIEKKSSRLVEVYVFLLPVEKEKKRWPEKVQRSRAWFDIESASARVREPTLKSLIASLENGLADVLTTSNLTHAAMTRLGVKRAASATRRDA
jgi:8-oxo-dGTP pyrophosphatase MutT (NUDIX family)